MVLDWKSQYYNQFFQELVIRAFLHHAIGSNLKIFLYVLHYSI